MPTRTTTTRALCASSRFTWLCLSLSLLLIATVLPTTSASATTKLTPAPRHYDSHTYYVLELDPEHAALDHSPEAIADALGAQHVEQVGHLPHHYLVRAPTDLVTRGEPTWTAPQIVDKRDNVVDNAAVVVARPRERDLVMERYDLLRRRAHGPASHLRVRSLVSGGDDDATATRRVVSRSLVRSLERQYPRQRVKRDLPVQPPTNVLRRLLPARLDTRQRLATAAGKAAGIIQLMATKFGIEDPLWPRQWHLVNGVIQQNSINVTGVWDEGVFGKGVNVAIVDDGLDMHSDDLAPNFVRFLCDAGC